MTEKLKSITDRYLAEMNRAGSVCACAGYRYDDGLNWSGWSGGFAESGPPFLAMIEGLLDDASQIDPIAVHGACVAYLEAFAKLNGASNV